MRHLSYDFLPHEPGKPAEPWGSERAPCSGRRASPPSSSMQRRDPANAPDDQHRPSSVKPGPASHDPDVRTENPGDCERYGATLEQGPAPGLIHDVHVLVDIVIELKAAGQTGDEQVTRRIVHLGGPPAQFADQAAGERLRLCA